MMALSAFAYFTNQMVAEGFHHLGFPSYFRVELGTAKIIGAIILLAPLPARLKEWAYAGFTIVFISAAIAHIASGDPASKFMAPILFLAVLIVSYVTWSKLPPAVK
jgi:uncharacterized membrane protein YphA (DoxX/SURF4 family)